MNELEKRLEELLEKMHQPYNDLATHLSLKAEAVELARRIRDEK